MTRQWAHNQKSIDGSSIGIYHNRGIPNPNQKPTKHAAPNSNNNILKSKTIPVKFPTEKAQGPNLSHALVKNL